MAAPSTLLLLGVADIPGNPPISTLTDDFATADTAKWTFGAAASVTGGRLVLTPNGAYTGSITTVSNYSLVASELVVELVQRPDVGTGTTEAYAMAYTDDPNLNSIFFDVTGSLLLAIRRVGGAQTTVATATYSATDHRWLRLRESAGTIYWDTSPDRSTWTNLTSWVPTYSVASVGATVGAGFYGTEPSPGTAIFDNFNVAPATTETHTTTGTATATASATGAASTTRTKTGAATATATGTRSGSSTRTKTATATATATATRTGSSVRTRTATAGATATATGTTTATRPKSGTATATATATRTGSSVRVKTATATATATASGTTSSTVAEIHTTAGTAKATATASGATTAVKRTAGTATLLAGATALTTTWRAAAGTALAHATASGVTVQGSAERDITLTVGPGRSRSLTAAGASRGLTAAGTASRSLTAEGTSRELAAAGRSRTLTIRPRE